jgi:hypothetical protein
MGGACGTHGRGEKCMQVLVRKLDRKIPLVSPRHKWKDNINMVLKQNEGVDWIRLAQDKGTWRTPVNTIINLWVP